MNPVMKVLAVCWGLTEEQLDDIAKGKTVQLKVGEAFCNGDEHMTEIRAADIVRGLMRVTPPVRQTFVDAIVAIGEAFDAEKMKPRTTAQNAELERAIGDAAGEGMGTARQGTPTPSAPPNTHPWTPEDKIAN